MKNKRDNLLELLKENFLIGDGAMGTYLQQKGFGKVPSIEMENLQNPEAVYEIHKEYIRAGAKIITTNTFKANRINFEKRGIINFLKDVNLRGVQIAKRAARGMPVFVGASLGPLSVMLKPYGDVSEKEAREICKEQVLFLSEEEPDLFIIETQQSTLEAKFFMDACKEVSPEVPILASLTVGKEGRTFFGDELIEGLLKLEKFGADILGINCTIGPSDTFVFFKELIKKIKKPLSVMPNGGYPVEVENKILYLSEPNYFANYSLKFLKIGAKIVGGCCGTTPETIRAIRENLKKPKGLEKEEFLFIEEKEEEKGRFKKREREGFFKKLGKEFVITCEVEPPKGPDIKNLIENLRFFKSYGADAVNIADNPMARVRVSPLSVAHYIQNETSLSTILHITCRDRNLLALQSDLLGAELLGVGGVLALGGDPTALGDYPEAKSVYDVNVVGLIKIVSSLNRGYDFSDNKIIPPTNLSIGIAINPYPEDLKKELEKIKEKVEAGAEFGLTQPLFDLESSFEFLKKIERLKIHILPGILPLCNLRQALYLKNEVPGIIIPNRIIKKMEGYKSKESQRSFGIEISLKILEKVKKEFPGAYITSGGRGLNLIKEILLNFSK